MSDELNPKPTHARNWWTEPVPSSSYPLSLMARDEDTGPSTRFMGGVMVVMMLAAYIVIVPLVNSAVTYLGFRVDSPNESWTAYSQTANAFANVWGVAAAHVGLISMIAVVWAFFHFMHHRRMAWIWSVSACVRWRYGLLCLLVALVVVGAVTAWHWVAGPGWSPVPGWGWYVIVILVTTPFQALAEEVMFRGYLMQAFGSIVRNVWFPIVCTALIFALFHGTQNLWLFGSRFLFGIIAGILVWRTGGVEAGVAIHIVNNLCAFGFAVFTNTLSQARTVTAVGFAQSALDVGMFAVCAVLCWLIAAAMRVPNKVKP